MYKPRTLLLKAIATAVSKDKVRAMCQAAGLSEHESAIMLQHYCEPRISGEQLAEDLNISIDQLNQRKEWLTYRLESFFSDNVSFFNFVEIVNLTKVLHRSSP